MSYRLVASDLDNTIVQHTADGLVLSPRNRRVLAVLRQLGIPFVPVTARTPVGLQLVPKELRTEGWALFGNGCLAQHLETGEVLFEIEISPGILQKIYFGLAAVVPEIQAACVRAAGREFTVSPGYEKLASFSDHGRRPATMRQLEVPELLAKPAAKLVLRHPTLTPGALINTLANLEIEGFEATTSGAPFVEIQAAGVTKASGLARLCDHLGITAAEVVAFGDAANDAPMLAWAGLGVAVANAVPETKAAANEVTASIEDDGVALVLERLLASGELAA